MYCLTLKKLFWQSYMGAYSWSNWSYIILDLSGFKFYA